MDPRPPRWATRIPVCRATDQQSPPMRRHRRGCLGRSHVTVFRIEIAFHFPQWRSPPDWDTGGPGRPDRSRAAAHRSHRNPDPTLDHPPYLRLRG